MAWSWTHSGDVLRALSQEETYADIVRNMRARVEDWKERFEDTPTQKTGWMHNYVCPQCTGYLKFDPDKPEDHRCPACGIAVTNTQLVLEAWTYMRRVEITKVLREAAILYRMGGDESDREFIVRVVEFYASHYAQFDEYGRNAGRGKIMGQSLDEAVWGVHIMKTLLSIGFDGMGEQGQRWYRSMFLPMSRLVVAQTSMIHNIPLWHAVCAFCAGLLFGDDWLVRTTVEGELGLRNQILKGFTADGIWYENSTGYHYYAMEAATNACLFARWAGREGVYADLFDRVIGAYTALLGLRFRDQSMIAFNDSNRKDGDSGIAVQLDLYLEAARLFDGMPGAEQIAAAVSEYDVRGTVGAFLFGGAERTARGQAQASVNLTHNCLGVLRGQDIEVFCKYGNLSRSHAHPDALQICIPPFARDLGNPGYGSPLYRGWYTQTIAHNTFVIDGVSQRSDARGTGALSEDGSSFALEISDAYEGVCVKRDLSISGAVLVDRMRYQGDCAHQLDWVFHSEGVVAFEGQMIEAALPETEHGYGYLTDVRRVEGAFAASFAMDGKKLTLRFDALPEGAVIYVCQSPSNPANRKRHTVIVRTNGREAEIGAVYEVVCG